MEVSSCLSITSHTPATLRHPCDVRGVTAPLTHLQPCIQVSEAQCRAVGRQQALTELKPESLRAPPALPDPPSSCLDVLTCDMTGDP